MNAFPYIRSGQRLAVLLTMLGVSVTCYVVIALRRPPGNQKEAPASIGSGPTTIPSTTKQKREGQVALRLDSAMRALLGYRSNKKTSDEAMLAAMRTCRQSATRAAVNALVSVIDFTPRADPSMSLPRGDPHPGELFPAAKAIVLVGRPAAHGLIEEIVQVSTGTKREFLLLLCLGTVWGPDEAIAMLAAR